MTNWDEIGPCIFSISNAFPDVEEVVRRAIDERSNDWEDAQVYDEYGQVSENSDLRKNRLLFTNPSFRNDVFWWDLAKRVWEYGNEYGKLHDVGFSNMENPQILHYGASDGYYHKHSDDAGYSRVFSTVLYLNDVEEGGGTYFNNFDITIKPEAGKIVFFPANFAYAHEAIMPKSNDKFSLVTWFNP